MERKDSASLEIGAAWNFGGEIEKELATSALKQRLPSTSVEIFRDLGMSGSAIADYFRRFPDLHRH